MINNNNQRITYTGFNKPSSIKTKDNKDTIKFLYNTNKQRFKKVSKDKTTYYLGKSYERTLNQGREEHKNLIYANGKVVATYTTGNKIAETNYLHYDNLGSVDTITNNQGVVIQRMAYKPFGEQLALDKFGKEIKKEKLKTNRGYTGHEHIQDTGLIHMNGRVYDPTLARFTSADPYIDGAYTTQGFNRYSYVKNNPLKYTDPSGYNILYWWWQWQWWMVWRIIWWVK